MPYQVRPGSRVVTSWTSHVLPSGSLKAKTESVRNETLDFKDRIRAAKGERNQVIDLIIAGFVRCHPVLSVCLFLQASRMAVAGPGGGSSVSPSKDGGGSKAQPRRQTLRSQTKSANVSPAIDLTGFKGSARAFRRLAGGFTGLGSGSTPVGCVPFSQVFGACAPWPFSWFNFDT